MRCHFFFTFAFFSTSVEFLYCNARSSRNARHGFWVIIARVKNVSHNWILWPSVALILHIKAFVTIAGRTARCRWKFRYSSNFTSESYVPFPCHSMAFWLQTAVNHLSKVISRPTRKNQSDRIFNADKYITWSLSISIVIIIQRQRNGKQNA